jgi:hypothetical protein
MRCVVKTAIVMLSGGMLVLSAGGVAGAKDAKDTVIEEKFQMEEQHYKVETAPVAPTATPIVQKRTTIEEIPGTAPVIEKRTEETIEEKH